MLKQVIVIRTDLKMEKGKACSQTAHASLEAFLKTQQKDRKIAQAWLENGMPKIVLKVDSRKELLELFEAAKKQIPAALIHDAGLTQIKPGEATAIALGPWEEKEIDRFTGKLKLL